MVTHHKMKNKDPKKKDRVRSFLKNYDKLLPPEQFEKKVISDAQNKFKEHTSKFGPYFGTDTYDKMFNPPEIIELETGKRMLDFTDKEASDEYERRQILASHGKPTPKTPPRYFDKQGNTIGAKGSPKKATGSSETGYDPYKSTNLWDKTPTNQSMLQSGTSEVSKFSGSLEDVLEMLRKMRAGRKM